MNVISVSVWLGQSNSHEWYLCLIWVGDSHECYICVSVVGPVKLTRMIFMFDLGGRLPWMLYLCQCGWASHTHTNDIYVWFRWATHMNVISVSAWLGQSHSHEWYLCLISVDDSHECYICVSVVGPVKLTRMIFMFDFGGPLTWMLYLCQCGWASYTHTNDIYVWFRWATHMNVISVSVWLGQSHSHEWYLCLISVGDSHECYICVSVVGPVTLTRMIFMFDFGGRLTWMLYLCQCGWASHTHTDAISVWFRWATHMNVIQQPYMTVS